MRIGVPKEIKNHEYRVGLTPAGVRELKAHGHEVMVQALAGAAIGLSDELFRAAGATVVATAEEIFAKADATRRTPIRLPGRLLTRRPQLSRWPRRRRVLHKHQAGWPRRDNRCGRS